MPNLIFTNQPGNWKTVDFPHVSLTKVSWDTMPHHALAYVFFGHVTIDFDGSPTAYAPKGHIPLPDDDIGNAGNADDGWFGVFALKPGDPLVTSGQAKIDKKASKFDGKFPVIQQAKNGDPNPGYYVSTTSGPVSSGFAHLQSSYVDSSRVSFGALGRELGKLGVNMGDYGLAIRYDQALRSGFYFVDAGAKKGPKKFALGECSHKVGKDLGGTGRASHFVNNFPVSFIIFPRSSPTPSKFLRFDRSDDMIKGGISPRLSELSRASNANELVMLMGLNEVSPPHRPRGKERLDAYLRKPGSPKPYYNYATIMVSLYKFGFNPYLPSPKKVLIF